jgi:peptidoglycan/LPS O-acetylase OafA/YrhL
VDTSTRHDPALDGLRGIAALAVFVYHVLNLSPAVAAFDGPIEFEFYGRNLDVGVEIFFVLSGYLLSRPFFASWLARSPAPDVRRYAVKRALRIYPAWIAFFTIALLTNQFAEFIDRGDRIFPDGVVSIGLWASLLHTWFFDPAHSSWTLSVEVAFYAFLPLFFALIGRLIRTPSRRAAFSACAVLAVVGTGSDWYHSMFVGFDRFIPAALVTLSAGMAIGAAVASADVEGRPPPTVHGAGFGWIIGGAIFVLMSRFVSKSPYVIFGALPPPREQFAQGLWQAAVAVFVVAAVVFSTDRGAVARVARWKPLVAFGTISYSFYLWHLLVLYRFDFIHATGPGRAWWMAAQGFAITVVISIASYRLVERPAMAYATRTSRRLVRR